MPRKTRPHSKGLNTLKKTILLSGLVAAAAALPAVASAAVTPGSGPDVSGVSMEPMLNVFNDLFTTHLPTIVAIAAVGFAIHAVVTIIRKAKGVAR